MNQKHQTNSAMSIYQSHFQFAQGILEQKKGIKAFLSAINNLEDQKKRKAESLHTFGAFLLSRHISQRFQKVKEPNLADTQKAVTFAKELNN